VLGRGALASMSQVEASRENNRTGDPADLSAAAQGFFQIADLHVDVGRRGVRRGSEPIPLTLKHLVPGIRDYSRWPQRLAQPSRYGRRDDTVRNYSVVRRELQADHLQDRRLLDRRQPRSLLPEHRRDHGAAHSHICRSQGSRLSHRPHSPAVRSEPRIGVKATIVGRVSRIYPRG
jgi:hypothetical protein